MSHTVWLILYYSYLTGHIVSSWIQGTATSGSGSGEASGSGESSTNVNGNENGSASGSGSGSGGSLTNVNGIGGVAGDPHVIIEDPGKPVVCFDFDGENGQVVNLLVDHKSGLEVNGLLDGPTDHWVRIKQSYKKWNFEFTLYLWKTENTFQGQHPRLNTIAIITPKGEVLDFHPDHVTINDNLDVSYNEMSIDLADGTLTLHDESFRR